VHQNEAHNHWLGFELAGLDGKCNDMWRLVWMSLIFSNYMTNYFVINNIGNKKIMVFFCLQCCYLFYK